MASFVRGRYRAPDSLARGPVSTTSQPARGRNTQGKGIGNNGRNTVYTSLFLLGNQGGCLRSKLIWLMVGDGAGG